MIKNDPAEYMTRAKLVQQKFALTIGQRLGELVAVHGSLRAVGRVLDVDHAYLSRLYHGQKKEPSVAVLKKLGLVRVVTYLRTPSTTKKGT